MEGVFIKPLVVKMVSCSHLSNWRRKASVRASNEYLFPKSIVRAYGLIFVSLAGRQEGDWMQISKDDGLDLSKPKFYMRQQSGVNPIAKGIEKVPDVIITKSNIKRKLRIEDLRTAEAKAKAWFVVRGEVSAYLLELFPFTPQVGL